MRDAAELYEEFLTGLFDAQEFAAEQGYDEEAVALLHRARKFIISDFRRRHPEHSIENSRALWL